LHFGHGLFLLPYAHIIKIVAFIYGQKYKNWVIFGKLSLWNWASIFYWL